MNDNKQAQVTHEETVPAPDRKDSSADAANQGHNGNPAQSAGRVTAQEQDAHPESTIEFEGKESKHPT